MGYCGKKEGIHTNISLTAARLRVLALILMLIDHTGRVLFPSQSWMICLGRLAFPIFAFQTAEGYRHTRDFRRYCLRLALFALISEIPFDRMVFREFLYPGHQNVMLTLLLGLLACRFYDRGILWAALLTIPAAALLRTDYGAVGVMTVLVFHVFREHKPIQLLLLFLLNAFGFGAFSRQTFAVLAWVPISLYRGEKGRGGKALQWGSYAFYPLHMLILALIAQ